MSILIFANGNLAPGDWVRPYLAQATALIAADGGVEHLLALDRQPDVVIGDLDSTGADLIDDLRAAGVEVLAQPEDKDESDLELALQYALDHYDQEIILLGALGGRLDQLLANVFLLLAPFLIGRPIKLVDGFQTAWILGQGENRIDGRRGDLVSLLPLSGDAQIKRTTGLAWPLADESLVQGLSRGISNRLTADTATVTLEDGTLLCVHLDASWQR
jgi:thiamine pyrophosphokinase